MKLFLSYASEDRDLAEEIQLALVGAGHIVFFDKASLPAGGDYHSRIEKAVQAADAFVFLVSPASVLKGSYALTELKFARAKWPHPKDKLISVRLHDTPWQAIPPYLKSVTVLEPEGNVAAEVAKAISELSDPSLDAKRLRSERDQKDDAGRKPNRVRAWAVTIGLVGVLGIALFANREQLLGRGVVPDPALPGAASAVPRESARVYALDTGNAASLADQRDATKAANEILDSLREGHYTRLWDTQTGAFFKATMSRDAFLANMTMGRQQFGKPGESKLVDMTYSQSDAASGTKGEIYAFNFLNAYAAGSFYERVVVIKEADGKFRMAGLWGSPAPK